MTSLNHKIKKYKLPLSFLLIIALFFSFGAITTRGLFTLGDLTRSIYDHPLVVSNASLIAALNITKMHRDMKDAVLARSPQEEEAALKSVAENEQEVYRQLDIIREMILGSEGQALEKQTRQLFSDWKPIRQKVISLLNSGNKKDAVTMTKTTGAEHVIKLETKMLELTSYARKKADGFVDLAEKSQAKLEHITIILTLSGVLLSVIIAFIATYLVGKAEKELLTEKDKLQQALDEIKTLRGIIPICSHCKQIRDDEGLWKQIEEYIRDHSEARFSHGICPSCLKKHYPQHFKAVYPDEK